MSQQIQTIAWFSRAKLSAWSLGLVAVGGFCVFFGWETHDGYTHQTVSDGRAFVRGMVMMVGGSLLSLWAASWPVVALVNAGRAIFVKGEYLHYFFVYPRRILISEIADAEMGSSGILIFDRTKKKYRVQTSIMSGRDMLKVEAIRRLAGAA